MPGHVAFDRRLHVDLYQHPDRRYALKGFHAERKKVGIDLDQKIEDPQGKFSLPPVALRLPPPRGTEYCSGLPLPNRQGFPAGIDRRGQS